MRWAGLVKTPQSEMSAAGQFRLTENSAEPSADRENPAITRVPERDNPLQLLRDAITQLKSSTEALPDREQVASLLAEARDALEHASLIAHAVAECDAHVTRGKFDQAIAALEESLHAYPGDPVLMARRHEVAERQKAFRLTAAVRGAIEEANWLLDHDRTDLAAQFLKQKAAELLNQEELKARLAELEALLPEWEEKRQVGDALARALTLEQLQQWQAALTVIDEARQAHPSSEPLREALERISGHLADSERRKKLTRRIELIGQQVAAGSWRQALSLLETTQLEFPGANELAPLRHEIAAGLRRSAREEAVNDVQKHLADGELEQAEQALHRAMSALGAEPALEALGKELDAERKYRGRLRDAQVLFGRGQFEEAEPILIQLLDRDRPEAQALLEAVRAARAAAEEENFLEQGREKALRLIRQQDFAQAADLLCNLLSLFPGDPILERDLAAAQAGLEKANAVFVTETVSTEDAPPAEIEALAQSEAPAPLPEVEDASGRSRGRLRRAAIAGTASLVLACAAGVAWKRSLGDAPAPQPAAMPPSALSRTPAVNEPLKPLVAATPNSTSATFPRGPARQRARSSTASNAAPVRPFIPPNPRTAGAAGEVHQGFASPQPPGTNPGVSVATIPALPALLSATTGAPAPPQPVVAPAPPQPAAPKPALTIGGKIEPPQIISRVVPTYPAAARQHALRGEVRLSAEIDEHGDVKNIRILAGNAVLGAAAKDAVMQWKYKPGTLNGEPISTATEIRIVFEGREH
jgi:periplasmic protein TonB